MNKQEKEALLSQIAPPSPSKVPAKPEGKEARKPVPFSPGSTEREPRKAEARARPITPHTTTGRTVAFYMDDEDLRILDEISLFLHMKGVKPNASLTIRALLREAVKDQRLVERARTLSELDGRRRRSLKREVEGIL
jgi:hypothetical protein